MARKGNLPTQTTTGDENVRCWAFLKSVGIESKTFVEYGETVGQSCRTLENWFKDTKNRKRLTFDLLYKQVLQQQRIAKLRG